MMKLLYGKRLFFSSVFILVIIISNTILVTNAQINGSIEKNIEFEELQTHTVIEQKPDLEIVDVTGSNDLMDPYFKVRVRNVGKVPFTCEIDHQLNAKVIIKMPRLNIVVAVENQYQYSPFPQLDPSKAYDHTLHASYLFGIYRCYFEIDADHYYEEEDEDNNKVWAYFFLRYIRYPWPGGPKRLTELQYWTTGDEVDIQSLQMSGYQNS